MKAKRIAYLGLSLATALATFGCAAENDDTVGNWQAQSRDSLSSAHLASLPRYQAAQLCLNAAQELEEAGYDREAAIQYERARRFDPSIPRISHRLAVLYDRTNQTTKALIEYGRALEAEPKNADLLNDIGYFYYSREQWAAAEEYLSRAVDIEANHTRAWTNLAMTYAQQQRYDEAISAFERVVSTPAAHSNVGMIMAQQGKYAMAKEALNWALSQDPELVQARSALEWIEKRERTATVPTSPLPSPDGGYMPQPTSEPAQQQPSVQSISHRDPQADTFFALQPALAPGEQAFVLAPPAPRAIPAAWYEAPRLAKRLAPAPSYGNAQQTLPMAPMPQATQALSSRPAMNTRPSALPTAQYQRASMQPAVNRQSDDVRYTLTSSRPAFDADSRLADQPRIAEQAAPAADVSDDVSSTWRSEPSTLYRLAPIHHRGR